MRRVGFSSLILTGVCALTSAAHAGDAPAAAAPAATPAAAAPAATPAAAPAATPAAAPAADPAAATAAPAADPMAAAPAGEPPPAEAPAPAGEAAPAAAPAEEETVIPGWFRIDSDSTGDAVQLWAGATYPLGGIGLAADMYVFNNIGEFDLGPAITAGPVIITPMLGMQFNWSEQRAVSFVPQLYVVGGPDPLYMELWVQAFMNSVFQEGASNSLYTRLFVDYKLSDYVAIGPQIEPTFGLNNEQETITSMPVGGNIMLSTFGKGGVFWFFLGYETAKVAREQVTDPGDPLGTPPVPPTVEDRALTGRLTFVYNF